MQFPCHTGPKASKVETSNCVTRIASGPIEDPLDDVTKIYDIYIDKMVRGQKVMQNTFDKMGRRLPDALGD